MSELISGPLGICVCRHSFEMHDRSARDWPVNGYFLACTFYSCYCPRFTEVKDG